MVKYLIFMLVLAVGPVWAQGKTFELEAPGALVESGFMKHLLPRFSLKTGVRITIVDGGGDAAFGDVGVPVFRGAQLWHFSHEGGEHTAAFEAWLVSDVGKRTIEAFAPEGAALFSSDVGVVEEAVVSVVTGDVDLGERVSLSMCGRCHVVNDTNRMNAIGSSPSFPLLRGFPDWQTRFETFFLLRPHPAFTQVEGVTEPFAEHLPSPISPIEVTLDELDAIMAYMESITPADLGAPIQLQ